MKRGIGLLALYLLCAWNAHAAVATHCVVCRQELTQRVYMFSSIYLTVKQAVCAACAELDTVCSICALPIRGPALKLSDGRLLCEREHNQCVLAEDELEEIFAEVKRDLVKMFSGHGTLPDRNVTVQLAARTDLDRLWRSQRFPHDKNQTMGLTQSRRKGRVFEHRILVLNGLRKSRVAAVCAHEYTHVWLQENMPEGRRLQLETVEGFCELVAYKLMNDRNDAVEQKVILENSYTSGQVHSLVKAEDRYRFYEIVKWMKTGVDEKIDQSNMGRVLVRNTDNEPVSVAWQPVKPTAVPDTLVLRGISGTPQRRFALVNDSTLAQGEEAKVRVGTTKWTVRCVQITENSVVLHVNGSADRTELLLKK
jgi:hypothetical protein